MGTEEWVEGDTGTVLQAVCTNKQTGAPVNLTGMTVELRFRINNDTVQTRSMTVTDAAGGIAEYDLQASDLTPGYFEAEVRIYNGGNQQTGLGVITKRIRKQL